MGRSRSWARRYCARIVGTFVAASVLVVGSIAANPVPATVASATPLITIPSPIPTPIPTPNPNPIPNEPAVDVCSGVQIGPLGNTVASETDATAASGPSFFVELKPGERPRTAREIELIATGLRIDIEHGVAALELSYVNHDEGFETKFRTIDPFTGPGEFTLSNDTLMVSTDLPEVPLTFEEILLNIDAFGEDQNTELVGVGFTTEPDATVNWFEAAGKLYVFGTPDCDDPAAELPTEEDPVAPSSVETAVK